MTLSREQIVDAAIRILDAEGPDALSMRRLGAELDAGAASIYWHVRGKDDLLDLVADRVIGQVLAGVGPAVTWRDWMEAFARSMRRVLLVHRGAALVVGRRATAGPNTLAALEAVTSRLVGAGFDGAAAILASTTLVSWTTSLVLGEAEEAPGAREAAGAAIEEALARGNHPGLTATLPGSAIPTADERFEYGLGVMLDGIEAREARRRRAPGVAPG